MTDQQTTAPAEAEQTEATPQVAEAPQSEDDAYGAVFDKLMEVETGEETPEEKPEVEPEDKPEGEEPEEGEAKEASDVPTDIPAKWKKLWSGMPEDARNLVLEQTREANATNSRLGQQVKALEGIKPVHDTLVEMAKQHPSLQNMPIKQLTEQMKELVNVNAAFNSDPVQAVLGIIKQHNLGPALAQVFQGQPVGADHNHIIQLQQHVQNLEHQLRQAIDPEAQQANFTAFTQRNEVTGTLSEFMAKAEHWGEVENDMPGVIKLVMQRNPELPARDVLKKAYDIAVREFVPGAKEKAVAPAIDPERTKAAQKAASVNVNSAANGKGRALTEDEMYSSVYDKAVRA